MPHFTCCNFIPDDYDDRRREYHETPEEKIKTAIVKLGEVVGFVHFEYCDGVHSFLGPTGGATAAREANTRTCPSEYPKPLRVISSKVCIIFSEHAGVPNTNPVLHNNRSKFHIMPL